MRTLVPHGRVRLATPRPAWKPQAVLPASLYQDARLWPYTVIAPSERVALALAGSPANLTRSARWSPLVGRRPRRKRPDWLVRPLASVRQPDANRPWTRTARPARAG